MKRNIFRMYSSVKRLSEDFDRIVKNTQESPDVVRASRLQGKIEFSEEIYWFRLGNDKNDLLGLSVHGLIFDREGRFSGDVVNTLLYSM